MASHPHQQASIWESIWGSFKESNYITDSWNWLMTLMSKSAEPVLFGSVLYSGYELLPNVPHPPALLDALVFIIQSAALDIGGMGLLKLAKRAGLPRSSFPVRVGVTLVALMIANVALASIKQAYPQAPSGAYLFVETGLLIARAVMAVLFGHAIYALREEVGDVSFTVKDVRRFEVQMEGVRELIQEVQSSVVHSVQIQVQQMVQSALPVIVQQSVNQQGRELLKGVHTEVQAVISEQVNQLTPMLTAQVEGVILSRVQLMLDSSSISDTDELRALAAQLQEVSMTVHEMHTTFTEARAVNRHKESLRLIQSPVKGVQGEAADEPVDVRVKRYISSQREQGHEPSLSEIMRQCRCSKGSAIRYRREQDGMTDIEPLSVVHA